MDLQLNKFILSSLNSKEIKEAGIIQELWSGYGEILRVKLENNKSVIVKHVKLPYVKHNISFAHQRKIKSYEVEINWYKNWRNRCSQFSYIPEYYNSKKTSDEFIIILEDLSDLGFSVIKSNLNKHEILVCLKWLANFHATFLNAEGNDLWEIGTYWQLATRPDELSLLKDNYLKKSAYILDEKLNNCKYKTFVHGDAKVENFCFSKDGKNVAAVDFQYVGNGCGIKDVIYFLYSVLNQNDYKVQEEELLNYYFKELQTACQYLKKDIDFYELENEWRSLVNISWADFYRFLAGWMYDSYNVNFYRQYLKNIKL